MKRKKKVTLGSITKYLVLIIFAIIDFYPFFWVLMSSFKDNISVVARPLAFPSSINFQSYITAWVNANIGQNFLNSTIYTVVSVMLIILFSSMTSFVLTRVWKSKMLYSYFTLGIMVPVHAVLIPSFIVLKNFSLYNTRLGFIVLMVAGNISLAVFILTSFMKGLPEELDDAARIDGCGYGRLYANIIFPLAKPGIATIGTLTLLNCWNEYLFAYIMLAREDIKTVTQGIFALQGRYSTDYAALCAGLVIAIVPMMTFFLLFQEQVIGGMTAGSVKG